MALEIDGGFLAIAGLRQHRGSLTVTASTTSWRPRTMMQAVYIKLEENEKTHSLSVRTIHALMVAEEAIVMINS